MSLRYGIIGCGSMGREHILTILALGGQVSALFDPHEPSISASLALMPETLAKPKIFTKAGDLIKSGLCDAVVVATPNFTHAEILRELLPSDLHILIEKPLCTTIADCQDVLNRAAGRRALVWVGQEYRYMPPVAELIRQAHAGEIGHLHRVSIREHREPFYPKIGDWNRFTANTGGTLVEKCCHYFNLMEFILRQPATSVFATGGQRVNHLDESYQGKKPDILDSAFVIVQFANGAEAMLDLCMFAENAPENEQIIAVGDKGRLETLIPALTLAKSMRADWGQRQIWGKESGTGRGVDVRRIWNSNIRYPGQHYGATFIEHQKFAEAIARGTPPEVNLIEGMRAVAIGIAAHQSIAEKRSVDLSEILGA
ncbi:MAG: Gfo/Idh/MocA family oxidoreductase [Alphaproteobacteria bacterium]|nr:Gfo/Idh/MocA family oxidoreductase [Alphaproteobacteria bacterium]